MGCVKTLIILPMTAFYLTVVTWGKGSDDLVLYPMYLQVLLKECGLVPVSHKTVGKLCSVIRLYALNGEREGFNEVIHKLCGRIGAVFLKSFHEAPSGILINGRVLEELLSNDPAVFKAGRGNKLHIHLNPLPGIRHLLIRFRDVFGIRGMNRHNPLFFEEAVESGDGAGIAALSELNPENDEAGIRITSSHMGDQLFFLRGMLIGVMVRTSGAFTQGFDGAVKTAHPAIDILAVGFIFDSCFGNAILLCVVD